MTRETPRKRVAVIGATGSVGSSVLEVCRRSRDDIEVVALAAHTNCEKLLSLGREFGAKMLSATAPEAVKTLKAHAGGVFQVFQGPEGLLFMAQSEEVDHIVFASSGTDAIPALQVALRAGKEVSLANKESVVLGGPWVMPLVRYPDQLRPLDSEHNALWQCLHGENIRNVRRLYLTASGGPFRTFSREELKKVTPDMALKHPVWAMGAKITIDSATLMNKGIELIEAMYLFNLEAEQLKALISPGSFVHGLVEFQDGFVKMLAGDPDMTLPAASCLFWPRRSSLFECSALEGRTLSFEAPDEERFPSIRLAKEVMRKKGPYPALLIGADEVAVERFLRRQISFTDIPEVIESTLESCHLPTPEKLEDAFVLSDWARAQCANFCDARE
ncbi:MAG: 1-deoxy-D-xylulose-5-phosphate reductoisomerase [Fretibacterium sp.]|nr:1-deoxy-D-xylulose-5-phosphate reductoisomerase [Fretibacterium sp.]